MRGEQLLIGISACWMHADEERGLYNGRPLLYLEQSMGEWLMRDGRGIPVMIPGAGEHSEAATGAGAFADVVDGLILQGGVDMAPQSYGETPLRPEWAGDAVRDRYELELVRRCLERDRPILGICRGQQVLNVALGGTLYQDIDHQIQGNVRHRVDDRYHEHTHEVEFETGARLRRMYGTGGGVVNSVHHQAVRKLGDGLRVEARCPGDGVIEAIRGTGGRYVAGVQWHPEFQQPHQTHLLSADPLLDDFFEAIERRTGG